MAPTLDIERLGPRLHASVSWRKNSRCVADNGALRGAGASRDVDAAMFSEVVADAETLSESSANPVAQCCSLPPVPPTQYTCPDVRMYSRPCAMAAGA